MGYWSTIDSIDALPEIEPSAEYSSGLLEFIKPKSSVEAVLAQIDCGAVYLNALGRVQITRLKDELYAIRSVPRGAVMHVARDEVERILQFLCAMVKS